MVQILKKLFFKPFEWFCDANLTFLRLFAAFLSLSFVLESCSFYDMHVFCFNFASLCTQPFSLQLKIPSFEHAPAAHFAFASV